MKSIVLNLPDDLAESIQVTQEELDSEVRLMAALKMFELGRISSGKAAEVAGLTRVEFFDACARYHVSIFNYDGPQLEAELLSDWETARKLSS